MSEKQKVFVDIDKDQAYKIHLLKQAFGALLAVADDVILTEEAEEDFVGWLQNSIIELKYKKRNKLS